ncbi:hypothetical protein VFPPC_15924 [Pochonia chlamydosporia 170]|uniref:Uncharacterized protein n=1 Tax=Pochonia chlamydosporia 170 TaxID=1380566 RepID=A0A179FU29_METCM|nr:hypothetical protein VFPPC_15924 [Pochonia chlamydosporia 170]OAQ69166.1 hypothetical protein VFPPC_15924 [Pochonia chlamydosporia 170]
MRVRLKLLSDHFLSQRTNLLRWHDAEPHLPSACSCIVPASHVSQIMGRGHQRLRSASLTASPCRFSSRRILYHHHWLTDAACQISELSPCHVLWGSNGKVVPDDRNAGRRGTQYLTSCSLAFDKSVLQKEQQKGSQFSRASISPLDRTVQISR